MPVVVGDKKITLTHPNGSSVELLLYGATILSWKSPSPKGGEPVERLFVSSKAALDGSKPVRGGIPVVFPVFGPPTRPDHSRLPQHGFARSEVWTYDRTLLDDDAGVSVRVVLNPTEAITAVYNAPFSLAYVVTLAAHQLSTDLHVSNPDSTNTLSFQALLHNYIAADSASVSITPLKGLSYIDKTKGGVENVEQREAVDVKGYTDSVYRSAGGEYHVKWNGGEVKVRAVHLADVVVWNPREEAGSKIGDMEPGGWDKYVCVEPGAASYYVDLKPGGKWLGGQVITIP